MKIPIWALLVALSRSLFGGSSISPLNESKAERGVQERKELKFLLETTTAPSPTTGKRAVLNNI